MEMICVDDILPTKNKKMSPTSKILIKVKLTDFIESSPSEKPINLLSLCFMVGGTSTQILPDLLRMCRRSGRSPSTNRNYQDKTGIKLNKELHKFHFLRKGMELPTNYLFYPLPHLSIQCLSCTVLTSTGLHLT